MTNRGIPTTAELAGALQEFLHEEVMPQVTGRLNFHVRVAGNVAAMLEREIRLGAVHAAAHQARLHELGVADDGELAAAIRDGKLDGRVEQVCAALRVSAVDSLRVINPRHLEPGDAPAA